MMTPEAASAVAAEWIAAWNEHDLERILSHYADDVELSSPLMAQTTGEATGTLRGRDALRAYWGKVLARVPDLRFRLAGVFCGVNSIVIQFHRHDGRLGSEFMQFGPGEKVIKSAAHYQV